jgi:hypothetical protein
VISSAIHDINSVLPAIHLNEAHQTCSRRFEELIESAMTFVKKNMGGQRVMLVLNTPLLLGFNFMNRV